MRSITDISGGQASEVPTGATLVVGFDGSDPSERALQAAVQMLRARRGRIEVVFVGHVPTAAAYSASALVEIAGALDETERTLAHQVGEVLDGQGIEWHFQRRDGEIADQLIAAAEEQSASSRPDTQVAVVVGGTARRIDRYFRSVPRHLIRRDLFRVLVVP